MLWTAGQEPFDYVGKYWKVSPIPRPIRWGACGPTSPGHFRNPIRRSAWPGSSKGSETLKLAGEHGFLPMSLNLNPTYVAEPLGVGRGRRGAAAAASPSPPRLAPPYSEVFVADTDEEASRLSVGGQMGRMMR